MHMPFCQLLNNLLTLKVTVKKVLCHLKCIDNWPNWCHLFADTQKENKMCTSSFCYHREFQPFQWSEGVKHCKDQHLNWVSSETPEKDEVLKHFTRNQRECSEIWINGLDKDTRKYCCDYSIIKAFTLLQYHISISFYHVFRSGDVAQC